MRRLLTRYRLYSCCEKTVITPLKSRRVCLFVCRLPDACLFICLFVCLLVYFSSCFCVCFFISLLVFVSACLSFYLFVCLRVCLFASLFVCLTVYSETNTLIAMKFCGLRWNNHTISGTFWIIFWIWNRKQFPYRTCAIRISFVIEHVQCLLGL